MNDLVPWLQDAVAAAFVVLGLVTAISWLRSRDRSMGFLALAIILLSAVSGLGRLQAHLPFTIPLLGTLNLLGFAGSGIYSGSDVHSTATLTHTVHTHCRICHDRYVRTCTASRMSLLREIRSRILVNIWKNKTIYTDSNT